MTNIIELEPASLDFWWTRYRIWFVIGFIGFFMFIKKNGLPDDLPSRKFHITLSIVGCSCIFISSFTQPFLLSEPIWIRGIILLTPIGCVMLHTSGSSIEPRTII